MKKVIVRCFSNNSITDKYHIIIYNKHNNIIFNNYHKCSEFYLYLDKDVYKIILAPLDINYNMLVTSFIVVDEINHFDFFLQKNNNSQKITTILVDKNYNNLPIERGKIILWQDHIR